MFAVFSLPLIGCASTTAPGPTGGTIFEVEYVNFAWVPTWKGFAIDSTGAIHSYDLEGKPWEPQDPDYVTRAELASKYTANPRPAGVVDPAKFRAMQDRAGHAAAGPLSEPQSRCADAGTTTYSAWIYDPGQDAYRRVLLWREGDIARVNQSTDATAITDWLMARQLLPRQDGCQP